MSWSRYVNSSNVSMVEYDSEQEGMIIHWANGKRSFYADVPEELAAQVSYAPSVGGMLNSDIKNRYKHKYI